MPTHPARVGRPVVAPAARVAVGYVRVSTLEQAREGLSLDAQRDRIRHYAASRGLTLARPIYADEGLSGRRSDNRPGLRAAVDAAVAARAPLVVCSLSRFARSTRDAIDLAGELAAGGADLISITESIDSTSAMGRFIFTLLSALGQLEAEQAGDRIRAVFAYKRARGEKLSNHPPYGQRVGADGVHLEPDEHEVRVIDRLVGLRLSPRSWSDVGRTLAAEGLVNRAGRPHGHGKLTRLFARFAASRGVAPGPVDVPETRRRRAASLVLAREAKRRKPVSPAAGFRQPRSEV